MAILTQVYVATRHESANSGVNKMVAVKVCRFSEVLDVKGVDVTDCNSF